MAKNEIEEGKICAALSYILIGIIWYFVDEEMKKNKYVKFHVKQGIILIIFSVIVAIANAILASIITVLSYVTFGGAAVLLFIPTIVGLIPLVLMIIGMVYAIQGKEKVLPVIGKFGKNFKI